MTTTSVGSNRRFHRDADRAILGGVCAGLAGYFGFNIKATRFLAFVAFLVAMPVAVIGYLAAVMLIPAESYKAHGTAKEWRSRSRHEPRRDRAAVDADKSTYAEFIDRRCRALDERLARLEKHVTSRRFQLDQELRRL